MEGDYVLRITAKFREIWPSVASIQRGLRIASCLFEIPKIREARETYGRQGRCAVHRPITLRQRISSIDA
jgi:hypothetical protein